MFSRVFPKGSLLEGKYEIGEVLGVGGMGVVFEARHVLLQKRLAVKAILPGSDEDAKALTARLIREARAASATGHRNITQVTDMGYAGEGSLFVVMEYLDGITLWEMVDRSGALPLHRAVSLIIQVLDGLENVHRRGIIHRDLKPENLMLVKDDDGEDLVKILDFGISKVVSSSSQELQLTATGLIVGSPRFLSPEQARGWSKVDHRADIYSAGAVLYLLSTGTYVHQQDNINALLAATVRAEIDPPSSRLHTLPEEFDQVLLRAMAQDPADRYQNARAFRQAIEPFCRVLPDGRPAFEQATLMRPGLAATLPNPQAEQRRDASGSLELQATQGVASEEALAELNNISTESLVSLDTVRAPTDEQAPVGETGPKLESKPGSGSEPEPDPADGRFAPPAYENGDELLLDRKDGAEGLIMAPRHGRISTVQTALVPPTGEEASQSGASRSGPGVVYGQARKASSSSRITLILVGGLVLVAAVAGWLLYQHHLEAQRRANAAQPTVQKVKIFFDVTPPAAVIHVDNVRVVSQPMWLLRSNSQHMVRVQARGYQHKTLYIRPDRDKTVQIALEANPSEPDARVKPRHKAKPRHKGRGRSKSRRRGKKRKRKARAVSK
jgi:serine/threonine-protein kinase